MLEILSVSLMGLLIIWYVLMAIVEIEYELHYKTFKKEDLIYLILPIIIMAMSFIVQAKNLLQR